MTDEKETIQLVVIDPKDHAVHAIEENRGDWIHRLPAVTGSDCFECICSAGHFPMQYTTSRGTTKRILLPLYVEDSGLYKYVDHFMHAGYAEPLAGPGIVAPLDEGDMTPWGVADEEDALVMPTVDEVRQFVKFISAKSH